MDLLAAIQDYATNGTDANALALQAVLPAGTMARDYQWNVTPPPYCIIQEINYSNLVEGTGKSYRIDEQTIQFTVYANPRDTVVAILDALEHAYLNKVLTTDNPCLAPADKDDRLISWTVDHYKGILNLTFMLQRSPQ